LEQFDKVNPTNKYFGLLKETERDWSGRRKDCSGSGERMEQRRRNCATHAMLKLHVAAPGASCTPIPWPWPAGTAAGQGIVHCLPSLLTTAAAAADTWLSTNQNRLELPWPG